MEIIKAIQDRRARRAYYEKPIAKEIVERILTAASYAPSCGNSQPWRIMVFDSPDGLARVRKTISKRNYWAQKAPLYVMILTKDKLDCMRDDDRNYAQFDTGMAAMNLMTQATAEGLYAHPMAGYEPKDFREEFGIESDMRLLVLIAIGYPGDASDLNERHSQAETEGRERKPLAEVVSWNGDRLPD